MKHLFFTWLFATLLTVQMSGQLIITGVYDGPLTGGMPKGIELYAVSNIADLSAYGVGSANNGNGGGIIEFTFPAVAATAGQFIYLSGETTEFQNFFGFAPDYVSTAMLINGDDAIELFLNGAVVDVFGQVSVDGSGTAWEYTDGWAYRNNGTGPDGSAFQLSNWTFSGIDALDNALTNATATSPFPIGTYGGGSSTPTVAFATASVNVLEDAGTVNVNLTLSAPLSTASSVTVSVAGTSTATNGSDFNFVTTTVNFPANTTSKSVSVSIVDDAAIEATETIVLSIANPSTGLAIGSPSLTTLQIMDNDALPVTVVINEIFYNAPNGSSLEFLELYNNSAATVNLSGYAFTNGITHTFGSVTIAPNGYLVMTNNTTNYTANFGTTPNLLQWTSGSLSNSGEALLLVNSMGDTIDFVVYSDVSPWSEMADGEGNSLALCNPTFNNNTYKNWHPEVVDAGFVMGTTPIFASPGAANGVVCNSTYPYRDIAWVTGENATTGIADSSGVNCKVQGFVYGGNIRPSGLQFTIIDALGNGISVFRSSGNLGYTVQEGDYVSLEGNVNQFSGLTQITPTTLTLHGSNFPLMPPVVVTNLDETTESRLVRLNGVTILNPSQWTNSGSGFNVDISNGADTFQMRIDADVNIYGTTAPTGTFDLIGLGGQFDNASPYWSGYQILPRYLADLLTAPATPQVAFANATLSVNENAGTVSVQLTLQSPNANPTSVQVALGTSTATAGSDFTFTNPTTVTFPANATTASFNLPIINDVMAESAETIVLQLQNPTNGATLGANSVLTVYINDNDAVTKLVITEIMYNTPGSDDVEFIEILNKSNVSVNLQGYNFTDGIVYTFPNYVLPANSYVVITDDSLTFFNYFGFSAFQWTSGALSNSGEAVVLANNMGVTMDSVFFDDENGWSLFADGEGASLELCDVDSDNSDVANWERSFSGTGILEDCQEIFASPGQTNVCTENPIVALEYHCLQYNEGFGTFDVEVFLDNANNKTTKVTVAFDAAHSTATTADFTFTSPLVLTFVPNLDTSINFPFTLIDDNVYEGTETIVLVITTVTNNAVVATDTLVISVPDNDPAPITRNLMITGVFDGPLTGGQPKGIELYALNNIPDLSAYGVGSANNGQGSFGVEYTFPAVAVNAGEFIYLTGDAALFNQFFGFAADFTDLGAATGINGDDAVELFEQNQLIDVFGEQTVDGTGTAWEYTDGWAYRNCAALADTVFTVGDWIFSGIDSLEGGLTNATCHVPFPTATYQTTNCNTNSDCPILWTNLNNTSFGGNSLVKSAGSNAWNGAARSAAFLPAGQTGYIHMEILETNTRRAFGLAQANSNTSFTDIDYALFLSAAGGLSIRENGVDKGSFGNYQTGDILMVERIGTTVQYLQNGVIFYTSTTPSTTDLYADVSINTVGGTIYNAQQSFGCDPCPTVIGVTTSAINVCEGETFSLQVDLIPGQNAHQTTWTLNGNVISTADNFNLVAPMVTGCTPQPVNYGWTVACNGNIISTGYLTISVENRPNATVQKDSATCIYTATPECNATQVTWTDGNGMMGTGSYDASTLTAPTMVTFILTDPTSTCDTTQIVITATPCVEEEEKCALAWQKIKNVSFIGDSIVKTSGGNAWNGAAISIDYLPAGQDGCVEMTILETNARRAFGLAQFNNSNSFNTINYALFLSSNGNLLVYESGVSKGTFGSYNTGDVLAVERVGTTVRYKKNGSVVYTSSTSSTTNLYADFSINKLNGTIYKARKSWGCDPCPTIFDAQISTSTLCFGQSATLTMTTNDTANFHQTYWYYYPANGMAAQTIGVGDMTSLIPSDYASCGQDTLTLFWTVECLGDNIASGSIALQLLPQMTSWTNLSDVTLSGETITKTSGGNLWNGAGNSTNALALSDNGCIEMTILETNTRRAFGLAQANTSNSFTNINYALFLSSNGGLLIRENGVDRGSFGNYNTGDRLAIEKNGTTILYKQNGTVFYTSTVAVTTDLYADFSINTVGGTIHNARQSWGCTPTSAKIQSPTNFTHAAQPKQPVLDVQVFPNPTNGNLTLRYDNNVRTIELFNLYGQKLNDVPVTAEGQTMLSINDLANGIYFVRFNGHQTVRVMKLN